MSLRADAAAGACLLSTYAERAEWQLGDASARIWIGGRVRWQIERRHARHGSIERGRPAGAIVFSTRFADGRRLATCVMSLGEHARVLKPGELAGE